MGRFDKPRRPELVCFVQQRFRPTFLATSLRFRITYEKQYRAADKDLELVKTTPAYKKTHLNSLCSFRCDSCE